MDWGLLLHCAALMVTLGRTLKSDKCGENIKIVEPGYLTSPGYPNTYHPSQKCEWLIQAPQPYQRIMINFNPHFDLEDRECKSFDFYTVTIKSEGGNLCQMRRSVLAEEVVSS